MTGLILKSTRVATPAGLVPAAIEINAGRIVAIHDHSARPPGLALIDHGDLLIMPGAVDVHVHLNEPGRTEWEGFATGTMAASAGGVTTVADMPLNSSPVTTTVEALNAKRAAASEGQLRVDVILHGGLVAGSAGEVGHLAREGVAAIKAFMCHSGIDEFPAAGPEDLRAAMRVLASLGLPLLAHAELVTPVDGAIDDPRSHAAWEASRPESFEVEAIALLIDLCRETRCPVHIVHLAAASALPMLAAARAEGLPITVETCPHYLAFCSESVPHGATLYKCAPPLRGAANREALWAALADGTIDLVASDHSPCPPAMKCLDTGDFFRAWGGIAGLELLLPATLSMALRRGIGISRVVEWLCTRPAVLAGLPQKGAIVAGGDADLAVVDTAAPWTVTSSLLHHRHTTTPYEGLQLDCRVIETWLRGHRIWHDQAPVGSPRGRLLTRRDNRI
jgi:allantoinase